MNRFHTAIGIAASSFLTAVVAVAAVLTTHEPQAAIEVQDEVAAPSRASDGWPAPQAPFDETVITPFESAGAPMVL